MNEELAQVSMPNAHSAYIEHAECAFGMVDLAASHDARRCGRSRNTHRRGCRSPKGQVRLGELGVAAGTDWCRRVRFSGSLNRRDAPIGIIAPD